MVTVTKDAIKRLLKDIRQINSTPLVDQGIYYVHDETDMMKGYALIIGPEDTPYSNGYYFFDVTYPYNYPYSPPVVKFNTNTGNIRFNPNLYRNGKVCVSLLNTWSGDQWTSCQTISTILLTLCTLLCKEPLLNEPGITKTHIELDKYNRLIEFANINHAICDVLLGKISIQNLDFFKQIIKEKFLKNYKELDNFVNEKLILYPKQYVINTNIYKMNIVIDYEQLRTKLEDCHNAVK